MSEADERTSLARVVLTSQIIIAAMVAGLLAFMGILLFVIPEPAKGPGLAPGTIFTYAAVVVGVIGLVVSVVVPRAVVMVERRKIARGTWGPTPPTGAVPAPPIDPTGDLDKLVSVYLTQLIIGAALNEGPAMFALIVYLLERNSLSLVLAVALILGVAARFPTLPRVEAWLDDQLEQVNQERQLGE